MKNLLSIVAAFGLVIGSQLQATAAVNVLGLFDTGVDNAGNKIAYGAGPYTGPYNSVADPHYKVGAGQAFLKAPPHANWASNTLAGSTSQWITLSPGTQANDPQNVTSSYTTTFNTTGFVLSSILINGRWATDNTATIFVNGVQLLAGINPVTSTGFSATEFATQLFSIPFNMLKADDFNTIEFRVVNASGTGGNPTGLRVEWTNVVATATPEPATLVVWSGLAAVGGLFAYRRRLAT